MTLEFDRDTPPEGWPLAMWQRTVDTEAKALELLAEDPSLPFLTATIMAGDHLSRANGDDMLKAGRPLALAACGVGSYSRLDWALAAVLDGRAARGELLKALPDLWRGSDPDDSDPRFLKLWLEARDHWSRKGSRGNTIIDGKPLPRRAILDVYRGQDPIQPGETFGIAWSLDRTIAEKFALGAATRQSDRGGIIYHARVYRPMVIGYLTKRGEAECIIDPRDLMPVEGDE